MRFFIINKIAIFLLFIVSSSLSFARPLVNPVQSNTQLLSLQNKTLREYPRLLQTFKDPKNYANIFWYNNSDCLHQPDHCLKSVDQATALKIQDIIVSEVLPRLQKFDLMAFNSISSWREMRNEIFPISYYIDLDRSIVWSYSTYTKGKRIPLYLASGDVYGTLTEKSRAQIGQIDATTEAIPTIALHEFGHILLRALDFPQVLTTNQMLIDLPIEEALADFITMISNENTPYIGPGIQSAVSNAVAEALKNNDRRDNELQKLKMETKLWGTTALAARDFSNPHSLQNAYILPENENLSLSFNSYLYKLMQIIGADTLRDLMLITLSNHKHVFLNGDFTLIIKEVLALYKKSHLDEYKNHIKSILDLSIAMGWTKPFEVGSKLDSAVVINSTSQDIELNLSLSSISSHFYEPKTTPAIISIEGNKEAHFSFLLFSDASENQTVLLKPTNACDTNNSLCICGEEKSALRLEGLFLNSNKQVEKLLPLQIQKDFLNHSDCYFIQLRKH